MIKVDDGNIGYGGLSLSDYLYLKNSTGVLVDNYGWADPAPDNYSIEKVRLELPNTPDNWKASKNALGTPGAPNSVKPLNIDGEIITSNTTVNPSVISINEKTYISVDIANIGLTTFTGKVIIDQSGTTIGTQSFDSLAVLDTSTIVIETSVLSSGEIILDITLEVTGDLDSSNNIDSTSVGVKFERRVMSINEFHSQPVDDQVEFVEILHRGSTPINLEDWRIADNRDGTTYRLPEAIIQPDEFVVISSDSSLYPLVPLGTHYLIPSGGMPALNNSGDDVRLFDQYNTIIDSLTFDTNWEVISGYSTEKILPNFASEASANWKQSVASNKMTPGLPNSVIPYNIDGAIQGNISFNPNFAKAGESVTAIVPVYNAGIQNINGTVTATFNGNIVGSVNSPSLNMGQTTFVNISLSSFPSGRHNILFDFSVVNDENLSNNTATKKLNVSYTPGLVKINEFHSNPGDNQIEFVELVSFKSIVMDGWRIADKSTSNLLPITYIEKGDYIVIASDTSLKPIANPDAKYLVPYGGLPTLNNTGDNIYLVDMNHTIIDSLSYGTGWPVVADSSTEKLRPDFISNDPVNWQISTASIWMTPGYVNSNYLIEYDGEIISESVHHEPEFPKSNESIQMFLPITNHGAQAVSGNVSVFENSSLIGNIGFTNITRRDTSILNITLSAMSPGIHPLQINMEVAEDQNLNNNNATDTIYVSYNFGDVTINEFLPRPISPQAEFVELFSFENVDLNNWSIADKTNTLHHFNGGKVGSNNFIVLSEDPAFATIIPSEA
ncbi:lamin tail domain-containing protein, partial [bacterium]|nr:lamin tail domain-containing protein [bacterium]